MFRLVNPETGKTLLESDKLIKVALFVEDKNRLFITANHDCVKSYMRSEDDTRPDVSIIRGKFWHETRMEI